MSASVTIPANVSGLNNNAAIYYLITHWQGDLWKTIAAGGSALSQLGYLLANYSSVRTILYAAGTGAMGYWAAAWALVSTVSLGTILMIFGSVAALA